jgi:hypothetical protein
MNILFLLRSSFVFAILHLRATHLVWDLYVLALITQGHCARTCLCGPPPTTRTGEGPFKVLAIILVEIGNHFDHYIASSSVMDQKSLSSIMKVIPLNR